MVCTTPMAETHASAPVSNGHKVREKRVRMIVNPVLGRFTPEMYDLGVVSKGYYPRTGYIGGQEVFRPASFIGRPCFERATIESVYEYEAMAHSQL